MNEIQVKDDIMKLAIKVTPIEQGQFIAQVDWTKGDAGEVGTSGAVKYADTEDEAYQKLEELLIEKGHTVIR